MFNRSRFNLQRYNIPSGGDLDVYITETMSELFSSMVTNGGNVYVVQTGNESINGAADIASGIGIGSETMETAFSGVAAGHVLFFASANMDAAFGSQSDATQNVYIVKDLSEAIESSAYLSENIHAASDMSETISALVFISSDYTHPSLTMDAIIDSQVTSVRFDVGYAYLSLTLRSGETLVIDSDNFVVLLNGENAIETHSGIWPEFKRETMDVQISSGTMADLVASILYTEKYL